MVVGLAVPEDQTADTARGEHVKDRQGRSGWVLIGLLCTGLARGAQAEGPAATDWPQWRGPTRDGVVASGPKLLDTWPTNGPALLWKSAFIPGYANGGCGSVVVAGGKALVFVNEARFEPRKLITDAYLSGWGWVPGMPDDLVAKVEAARLAEGRRQATTGAALDAYVNAFLATMDPVQSKAYGTAIGTRLRRGQFAWSWQTLATLATNRDTEFTSFAQFKSLYKGTDDYHQHGIDQEVFVIGRTAQHFYDMVICLDAATGREQWRRQFPGSYTQMFGGEGASCACGTPAIANGRCYVAGSAGLYCLNVTDGTEVWKITTKYSNSSVLALDGSVYAMAEPSDKPGTALGGSLCAYDAASGKLLWKQAKLHSSWGSSVVSWVSAGKTWLICNCDGSVCCVEPSTGRIVWDARSGGHATPAISGDIVVVHGDKLRAYRMSPEKAELLWEMKSNTDRMSSPVIYQGCVFWDGAYQTGFGCVALATGVEAWHEKTQTSHCSSLVAADGKVFMNFGAFMHGYDTESVRMFKATPQKFEELGRFSPHVTICSSPTLADGRLYLRLDDAVACYDLRARQR